MRWDEQVQGWLDGVLGTVRAIGLADLLERTIAQVWERNVDRYDPAVAGDTATSLGITASENIRTLLLREDLAAWAARGVLVTSEQQALVLRLGTLRLLLMKVPDRALGPVGPAELGWDATRWDTASDVRRHAAHENAGRYEPGPEHQWGQTWWRGLVGDDGDADPVRLRHIVLVWTGDPRTAVTTGWLAVPYAGPPGSAPWLAATEVWHHGPDLVPRPREPLVALPRTRTPLRIRP
ncbi:hypothetical protein Acsp06_12820 [Actinomycetospora sp. NBRC 106375]|uniref:hypothetical protein n=1 Tax=Actinomycetospora sp. NBRC 106375 TaxID=3032207 RepID=UPI0024A0E5FD|nr:hypothetical protein [Actinomycetospora sp. NBRC 106375]GLZ45097.1 hypothetical protein Acsp06_12820 [Actinomycetospora sp. NBRC 106375]